MAGSKRGDRHSAAKNEAAVHQFVSDLSEAVPNNSGLPICASDISVTTANPIPPVNDQCVDNEPHGSDTVPSAAISSKDVPQDEIMIQTLKGEESLNESESQPNWPANFPLVLSQGRSKPEAFPSSYGAVKSSAQRPKIELAPAMKVNTNAGIEQIQEEQCPPPPLHRLDSDKIPKKEGMGLELIREENCVPMPQVGMMTPTHIEKIKVLTGSGAPMPVGMMTPMDREKIKVQAGAGATKSVGTDQEPGFQPCTLAAAIDSVCSSVVVGNEMPAAEEGGHARSGFDLLDDSIHLAEGQTHLSTIHEESNHIEQGSTVPQGQRNDPYTTSSAIENQSHFRVDYSLDGITEAYLVEDDVVVALPTKPWWKQRRTHFFAFSVVVILSLLLGITLSRESRVVETQFISTVSTTSPSNSAAPSSSRSPSFLPSSCSFTISSNAQKLDLLHPEASDPVIAIDGRNLVVASRVIPAKFSLEGGSLLIEFYSLSDENKWERVGDFAEGGIDWAAREVAFSKNEIYSSGVYVSLSGGNAMVGTPSDTSSIQSVIAYRKTSYERWARVSDGSPQISGWCGFGVSAMLDDTLMVTSDFTDCGYTFGPNSAYLFKLFRDKWIEVGDLSNQTYSDNSISLSSVREASISGDIIVVKIQDSACPNMYSPCHVDVYRYDPIDESVTRMGESLENITCSGMMSLSGDHFAHANDYGVSVYQMKQPNSTFSSPQFIDSSDYGEGFGRSLSMDEGILIVGSNNYTHVFSLQENGRWDEMLVLHQSFDHYQISGRALVAANRTEAFAMNIANCMPPIPTPMPSVSSAPFTCLKVEFNFSNFVSEWDTDYGINAIIQKIDGKIIVIETFPLDEGDWDEIKEMDLNDESLPDIYDDQWTALSYSKSMCLLPGSYEFILNLQYSGRTIDHYYTVISDGQIITQGAINPSFWYNKYTETIGFNLPFDGETTQMRPTNLPSLLSTPYQTGLPTLNENKLTPSLVPVSLYIPSVTPTMSNSVSGTSHKTSLFPTIHFKTRAPNQSSITPSPTSAPTIL